MLQFKTIICDSGNLACNVNADLLFGKNTTWMEVFRMFFFNSKPYTKTRKFGLKI